MLLTPPTTRHKRQGTTTADRTKVGVWTRELIDAALSVNGAVNGTNVVAGEIGSSQSTKLIEDAIAECEAFLARAAEFSNAIGRLCNFSR